MPEHLAFTRRTNYSLLHKIDPEKKARPDYMVGYEMPAKDNECNTLLPITTKENVEKFKDASTEFLRKYPNAILIGRLATYQYLDMDDVIDQCYSVLYGHQLIDSKSHTN
jgi:UDP-galactopyranose mutase